MFHVYTIGKQPQLAMADEVIIYVGAGDVHCLKILI
jgi:hypothetical protein